MSGDPKEEILEGESHTEVLEKTIKWLKENKGNVKDEKVVVNVFQTQGKWRAFIRYITTA